MPPIRVIQITDMHLMQSPQNTLLGVNTHESFSAVIELLKQSETKTDFILITGDIAQEAHAEAYNRFKKQIEDLGKPYAVLPGNHDAFDMLETYWPEQPRLISIQNWQILLLKTPIRSAVHGHLAESELILLQKTLKAYPDKPLLVAMHHHPLPSGSEWLDQFCLDNASSFFSALDASNRPKIIVCGHIHQAFKAERKKVEILACPSTCFQFKPHSLKFTLDEASPGYRWFDLYEDGSFKTGIHRLKNYTITVDTTVTGY